MMQDKSLILYFFLFLQPAIFAMELIPLDDQNHDPLQSIVDLIDVTVNTKYSKNMVADFFTQSFLTEEDFFDIAQTIASHCSTIHQDLISALCKKNNFINIAVMHFFHYARENIERVTIDTLLTINNPDEKQPIEQLNRLSPSLRSCIMKCALGRIKHSYIMPLEHNERIIAFDICAQADLVATTTCNQTQGSNVIVWDLKKCDRAQEITTQAHIASLCFNNTGSQLAASARYNDEYSIEIWNTTAGTKLYTIPVPSNIVHIGYMNNTIGHKNILLCHRNTFGEKRIILDEWSLQTKDPQHKRSCEIFAQYYIPSGYIQGNYQASYPLQALTENNILEVKKKNCNYLYLLEKAIINSTTPNALQKLKRMQLFQDLTAYEKDKLQKMYVQKGMFS